MEPKTDNADREISTTRIFDAPRPLVWDAWTKLECLEKWWGPNGFTTTTEEFDLRVGGKWLFTMHGPDGTDYRNDLNFTNVVRFELIEWTHGPTPRFDIIVKFTDDGENRTRLSMRMVFTTREERDRTAEKFNAVEGQRQTLDRLEEHLRTI